MFSFNLVAGKYSRTAYSITIYSLNILFLILLTAICMPPSAAAIFILWSLNLGWPKLLFKLLIPLWLMRIQDFVVIDLLWTCGHEMVKTVTLDPSLEFSCTVVCYGKYHSKSTTKRNFSFSIQYESYSFCY